VLYAGDTGRKLAHVDDAALAAHGESIDLHGKMPDVVLHDMRHNGLLLAQSSQHFAARRWSG
jgi:hypothetical protein